MTEGLKKYEKIIHRILIIFILCLFLYSTVCTRKLDNYRGNLDTVRNELTAAEEYNRELTERLGSISDNVQKLGDLTERNISGVRQCIEIIEETRVIVQELESICGRDSQREYYQYWDSYFGIE